MVNLEVYHIKGFQTTCDFCRKTLRDDPFVFTANNTQWWICDACWDYLQQILTGVDVSLSIRKL